MPLTRLTASIADAATLPVWSPDGSKIAYSSTRGFNADGSGAGSPFIRNVWVLNADGSMDIPLTRLTFAAAGLPEWQP